MNCISGWTLPIVLFGCIACNAPALESAGNADSTGYAVHYTITPAPDEATVAVEMSVVQTRGQLRELSFSSSNANAADVRADSGLVSDTNRIVWQPGQSGGTLRWTSNVTHQRGGGGYDAWLGPAWGIFRAEDIIPRARTRTLKNAVSHTTMSFELPGGWSALSEHRTVDNHSKISDPDRRFDQPRGWIILGDLGVRRETIAGTRVAVAGVKGESVRRMDMLALLNWTLPELDNILPDALPRLTIVSAGDPMWRGALSAPESIYIHAERPLISENATSTLMHETVHVALDISADEGFDWIVEGLAEYYSLELLHRGGAITTRRYGQALEEQSRWAKDADRLCDTNSTGATTALAVITFRKLDAELSKKTAGRFALDDLLIELSKTSSRVNLAILEDIVTHLLQEPADVLNIDELPGCQPFVIQS